MIDRGTLPTISETLIRLGASVRGRRSTGICHDSHTPGVIAFDDHSGVWFCHRCGHGGDVVDLIKHTLKTDFRGALCWLGIEPGKPPAPDPAKIRKCKIRAGLLQWSVTMGRRLRIEFRAREQVITLALRRLRLDHDDPWGWTWLGWALPGKDHIEEMLDMIDIGTQEQQLAAFKDWRVAV